MIVVDTNVVSEAMRLAPSPQVLRWLDKQRADQLFTTAVTVAEIYYGIELLPKGKRRATLLVAAEAVFEDFRDRILAFDGEAARVFSRISASRRASGRSISQSDAQIAAIVQLHGATLATHNLADFENCGIHALDPWQS